MVTTTIFKVQIQHLLTMENIYGTFAYIYKLFCENLYFVKANQLN